MSQAAEGNNTGLCLVNGNRAQHLSVFDRGLAYGDGLFETIRVVNSQLTLQDLHLKRLQLGLQKLHIPASIDIALDYMRQLVNLAVDQGQVDGVIKLIVTRGTGGRGFNPHRVGEPTLVCSWHALPEFSSDLHGRGLDLHLCELRLPYRPALAGLKHLNCLDYVMASAELQGMADCDGLLLDADGRMVEAITANLFLLVNGELQTPRLHRCGVAGTMRRWIMECTAMQLGIAVAERDLPLQALDAAGEVFICNSVRGVIPVRRVGRRSWQPGAVTAAIQQQVATLFNA